MPASNSYQNKGVLIRPSVMDLHKILFSHSYVTSVRPNGFFDLHSEFYRVSLVHLDISSDPITFGGCMNLCVCGLLYGISSALTNVNSTRYSVLLLFMYRVIRNDCLGFNNLSYTIHLR